jgi:hypothetical protein
VHKRSLARKVCGSRPGHLQGLLANIAAASPEDAAMEAARCMRKKTAGSLGKFADWAESAWRNRHSSAARLLLAQACR